MTELTDEQISEHFHATVNMLDFARAVIAADRAAQQERKPMTQAQRRQVLRRAEAAMSADINLSWRDAIMSETEIHHDIKDTP